MTKILNRSELGDCPLCGHGKIVRTPSDYACTNKLYHLHGSCKLSIPLHYYGVDITERMVKELITNKETEFMTMTDGRTKEFRGKFMIVPGKGLEIDYDKDYINARCPKCGGRMVKTRSRYECENSLSMHPTCSYFISNFMKKRNITVDEVEDYLNGKGDILDGFISDEKREQKKVKAEEHHYGGDNKPFNGRETIRMFSAYLAETDKGIVGIKSDVGKCPFCGGTVFIGDSAFNCSNFKEKNCGFHLWKSYERHRLSLIEVKNILNNHGILTNPYIAYDDKGRKMLYTLQIDRNGEFIPIPFNAE